MDEAEAKKFRLVAIADHDQRLAEFHELMDGASDIELVLVMTTLAASIDAGKHGGLARMVNLASLCALVGRAIEKSEVSNG